MMRGSAVLNSSESGNLKFLFPRQRLGLAAAPHLDDLGHDGQRDFLRRLGRNVEADWRMDARNHFLGDLVLVFEPLEARLDAPPASDHADVLGAAVNDLAQTRLIVFVAACDEDDVGRWGDGHRLELRGHVADADVVRVREPLAIGEKDAVVEHDYAKVENFGDLDERYGD